mgnify:CR=1 FL=1
MDNTNNISDSEYTMLFNKCTNNKSKYSYKFFYNYKNMNIIRKFRIYLDQNKKLFYFDENNNTNYLKKIVYV